MGKLPHIIQWMVRWFDGLMVCVPAIKPSNHLTLPLISVFLLVVVSLFLSCEQRDELAVQVLIKEQVASNVKVFRNRRIEICYKEAMAEAVYIADSIAIAQALASKDTSRFIRPVKPAKPPVVIPKEDTPVAPLFKKRKEGEED